MDPRPPPLTAPSGSYPESPQSSHAEPPVDMQDLQEQPKKRQREDSIDSMPKKRRKSTTPPRSEKSKGKQRVTVIDDLEPTPEAPPVKERKHTPPSIEPLSAYTCPICFGVPTYATITPCGHVCCGECLFAAVNAAIQRNRYIALPDGDVAKCPVCRAVLPGWDGRGGGVIGLRPRAIFAL